MAKGDRGGAMQRVGSTRSVSTLLKRFEETGVSSGTFLSSTTDGPAALCVALARQCLCPCDVRIVEAWVATRYPRGDRATFHEIVSEFVELQERGSSVLFAEDLGGGTLRRVVKFVSGGGVINVDSCDALRAIESKEIPLVVVDKTTLMAAHLYMHREPHVAKLSCVARDNLLRCVLSERMAASTSAMSDDGEHTRRVLTVLAEHAVEVAIAARPPVGPERAALEARIAAVRRKFEV